MSASSSGHILIVEDDGDLLEVLRLMLEDEGYRVSTAARGADALSAASLEGITFILLDVSMPDISGIEVARRLRADPRTRNIRLALHTGRPIAEIREQFTDYDAFIAKTESADELMAAIKAAMSAPLRTAAPA